MAASIFFKPEIEKFHQETSKTSKKLDHLMHCTKKTNCRALSHHQLSEFRVFKLGFNFEVMLLGTATGDGVFKITVCGSIKKHLYEFVQCQNWFACFCLQARKFLQFANLFDVVCKRKERMASFARSAYEKCAYPLSQAMRYFAFQSSCLWFTMRLCIFF